MDIVAFYQPFVNGFEVLKLAFMSGDVLLRVYLWELRSGRFIGPGFHLIRVLANFFAADISLRSGSAQFTWISPHGLCSLSPGIYSRAVGFLPGPPSSVLRLYLERDTGHFERDT
jgi:hypothetical protein